MGKKGRCRSRTIRTVMKERLPVGSLAQRRKQMQEEFIAKSCTYQNERKKIEKVKVRVFIHSLFQSMQNVSAACNFAAHSYM